MPEVLTEMQVASLRGEWGEQYPCVCPADAQEKKLTCTSCRMFFIVRKYGGRRGLEMLLGSEDAEVLSAL